MFILLTLIFGMGYAWLIYRYQRAWEAMPEKSYEVADSELPMISIIIPARDEEVHIGACLRSIMEQDYPSDKMEVIVIDDHSADGTASIVEEFAAQGVQLIRLSDRGLDSREVAYKKRAIEAAVADCVGEVVVTTDADCRQNPKWLKTIGSYLASTDDVMITGPVRYTYSTDLFTRFQALDFVGMIGITAASLHMGMFNLANGANLAFRKSAFMEVSGYSGIDRQASGDDMLLIHKMARASKGKVGFLKSPQAMVETPANENLRAFIQQRMRWTSKSFAYQDKRITWILAFVYLTNVWVLVSLVRVFAVSTPTALPLFLWLVGLMSFVDYRFLKRTTAYFGVSDLMRVFLPSQVLHVFYIVILGLAGNLLPYNWKGRKLS